jgi:hypothetical protein
LRGVGANMSRGWIIFDEFCYMVPSFFEAILPTLSTGAAGAMISSVSKDPDNPVVAILDAKYRDGSPIFKLLSWELVMIII